MGIADRDYGNQGGGFRGGGGFGGSNPFGRGGGIPGGGFRMWSANTWLIVINVAVFFVAALLPSWVHRTGGPVFADGVESSQIRAVTPQSDDLGAVQLVVNGQVVGVPQSKPIFDTSGGEPVLVGAQPYRVFDSVFHGWGHFSTGLGFFKIEVWRLLTFQFLHANLGHVAFNMIGLFFFGPLVESHLRSRRLYLAYYFTCGMAGALLYLMLNGVGALGVPLPGALNYDIYTPLIGASAGVFGILMASAFIAPKSIMYVMGILPVTIRTGAYVFVALAALNLLFRSNEPGSNAGGDAAHLGGAIAGYFFIRRPQLLLDFFDGILKPANSAPGTKLKVKKKGKAAKAPRAAKVSKARTKPDAGGVSEADRQRVDELLAKVGMQGLHSLTDKERDFLEKTTEKMNRADDARMEGKARDA